MRASCLRCGSSRGACSARRLRMLLWIVVPLAVWTRCSCPRRASLDLVFAHGSPSATIAATLRCADRRIGLRYARGAARSLDRGRRSRCSCASSRSSDVICRASAMLDASSDARIVRASLRPRQPRACRRAAPAHRAARRFRISATRHASASSMLAHERRAPRARRCDRRTRSSRSLRCLQLVQPARARRRGRSSASIRSSPATPSVIRRFPEARRPYADAMLKTQLADQSRQELRLPVGCRWPSGHPLKERIHMLKKRMPTRARRTLGTAVAACLAIGGGYASWSMQPARASRARRRDHECRSTRARSSRFARSCAAQISARPRSRRTSSGDVTLRVHVNAKGEPESAEIASLDPADAAKLGDAAIATVMKWRFNPALSRRSRGRGRRGSPGRRSG